MDARYMIARDIIVIVKEVRIEAYAELSTCVKKTTKECIVSKIV